MIEIVIGYVAYVVLLALTSLSAAILWLFFIVYFWLLLSLWTKTYNINSFIYILCGGGILVAISFFFLQGVEELPYPQGAVMFHLDNIVKACFLFFICSIPMLVVALKSKQNPTFVLSKEKQQENPWEEASSEDLTSGRYEPL